ncbi:MAG: 3-oxoacyl-ACP synthase [Nitrospiraceae bacterium]|nr:3-oxoacyl-ACP synthase [Nitrospiraceae bacterium]|tara:strand:- start:9802 stop:10779 length:978 start_codon:yes stop_codon:yes gene_type:complete
MRARVVGTGSYVPRSVITNSDLEQTVNTSDQWITERTGIRSRYIASPGEGSSALGAKAATIALATARLDPADLDLIIVATCTPDMPFPSTACLIQSILGAKAAVAFDVSAACSGFLFALSIADHYIRLETYRNVLVVGTEVMSSVTDWTDRATCIIFGDGAGAAVLQGIKGENGILSNHLHSNGQRWDLIYVPGGGSQQPLSETVLNERLNFIKMRGSTTFKLAVKMMEEAAREALAANNLTIDDIDLFIPHQANARIIKATAERLHVPMERVVMNIGQYGNTSAASVPLALDEMVRENRIKSGTHVLLIAFGSGLTWASTLIRW